MGRHYIDYWAQLINESEDCINESENPSELYNTYGNKYKVKPINHPKVDHNWRHHLHLDYPGFPMPCRYIGIIAIEKYGEKPSDDNLPNDDNLWWFPLTDPRTEREAMDLLYDVAEYWTNQIKDKGMYAEAVTILRDRE